jgi:hypothetical protein
MMKAATSTPTNDQYKTYFKGGGLSVCCPMRADEEAVTR